jgi:hypothetical protein
VVSAGDQKLTAQGAKQALWDTVGLTGDANRLLRIHLYSFLAICLAPPEQREKKASSVGELIGKLSAVSPGASTSNSASGS